MTNSWSRTHLNFSQFVERPPPYFESASGDYPFVTALAGGLICGYAVFDAVWGVA